MSTETPPGEHQRRADLEIRSAGDEALVYDATSGDMHLLDADAARVLEALETPDTVDGVAARTGLDVAATERALDNLGSAGLLHTPRTRRSMLRVAALGGGAAFATLALPTPAMAASTPGSGGGGGGSATATTTTLTLTPSTVETGQSYTPSATVTAPSAPGTFPQGTVQLWDVTGPTLKETVTLPVSGGSVTFAALSQPTAGTKSYYATYVPGTGSTFATSTSPIVAETISATMATQTVLTGTDRRQGMSNTATATVTRVQGGAAAVGSVNFVVTFETPVPAPPGPQTVPLNASGAAAITFTNPLTGKFTVQATYLPATNYGPSNDTETHQTNPSANPQPWPPA